MKKDSSAGGKNPSLKMKGRVTLVNLVIGVAFFVLIVAIGYITLFKHDEYSSEANSQQLLDTAIAANRGVIYDRNGNVLAMSATVWTVAVEPVEIDEEEAERLAQGLSEILGISYESVLRACSGSNAYSIVQRKVDKPVCDEIRAFLEEEDLGGVIFTQDSKRYYPYGNFCSQILGFVGTDNYGLSGIEAYYDSTLAGTAGRIVTARNAVGSEMYYEYETIYESEDGFSLILTIDQVIQHHLESALETAVAEHNVQNRATGIIMDVNTGEILAMATKGDYDPNEPFTVTDPILLSMLPEEGDENYAAALYNAQQMQWNNKAISEVYEPGSVFKCITAATALEIGACTLDDTFYCTGSYTVIPSVIMNCAHTEGHGHETFTEAIINSCNPAFIQIGQAIGAEDFYSYFKAFGLTEPTGIDLPGESESIYYTAENLGIVELASCSYGQSNAVTPIQMITAFCAVVNGGYLLTPHIVSEVLDADGNVVASTGTEVVRQVISEETSETMCMILEQVVERANGANAYVAGYRIGGKSGTSQKLGGEEGVYVSSFIAFAPADDPQIAVLILLDEANSYSIYGSTLVGPIVSSVMSNVLPYIGVEAVYTDDEMRIADVSIPNLEARSLTQAYSLLQSKGLKYEVVGSGTSVVGQFPRAGQAIPKGSTIYLYTEDGYTTKMVEVPDLSDRSEQSVITLLSSLGLNLRTSGSQSRSATAVSQSIDPGESVEAGTLITVEFVDSSLYD